MNKQEILDNLEQLLDNTQRLTGALTDGKRYCIVGLICKAAKCFFYGEFVIFGTEVSTSMPPSLMKIMGFTSDDVIQMQAFNDLHPELTLREIWSTFALRPTTSATF